MRLISICVGLAAACAHGVPSGLSRPLRGQALIEAISALHTVPGKVVMVGDGAYVLKVRDDLVQRIAYADRAALWPLVRCLSRTEASAVQYEEWVLRTAAVREQALMSTKFVQQRLALNDRGGLPEFRFFGRTGRRGTARSMSGKPSFDRKLFANHSGSRSAPECVR